MDDLFADDARGIDSTADVEQRLNRLLEEETRRIQGDNDSDRQVREDESILLNQSGPAHLASPEVQEIAAAAAPVDEPEPADEPEPVEADLDEPDMDDVDELDEDATVLATPAKTRLLDDRAAHAADDEARRLVDVLASQGRHDETVPGVIPVDSTVLRPQARQIDDEHVAVRNTRDYDHDAQSINVVMGAGNFETIVDDSSDRELRHDPYARSSRSGSEPGEGNSRSKLRPLLAILLVALVLCGGGAVLSYGMEMWGGKKVPYVIGESQANAEARLAEKGLTANVTAEPADDAIGKVLRQEPESGTRIPEGDAVTLVVAANRTIPTVVGLTTEEAQNVLIEAGAANIEIQTEPSSKAEGTVLAVSPEEGAAFVSRSPVVLTVATHFTVPDVVGKKETDAVDILKQAGLNPEVTYIKSDKTVRTVVSTNPAANEIIDEGGTVVVKVSTPYPSDVTHLSEFFGHSSQDVDAFLLSKGFTFDRGGIDNLGNAVQIYTSSGQGTMTFSSQPYVSSLSLPSEGSSNVLSTGAPIAGVRLECPSSMVPDGYTRSSLIALAKACGFKGLTDTCSNGTMNPPAGSPAISAKFACGSGEMGNLAWTVLVVNGRAVATCAKKSLYSSSDLQPFGGSLCRFMAYQEVYLSSQYQVKEEKKTEEKDDKKDDDSKDDEATASASNAEQHNGN